MVFWNQEQSSGDLVLVMCGERVYQVIDISRRRKVGDGPIQETMTCLLCRFRITAQLAERLDCGSQLVVSVAGTQPFGAAAVDQ